MKSKLPFLLYAIILIVFTSSAYFIGSSHRSSSDMTATSYAQGLASIRQERDQALNNYDSACANYRTLYAAYNTLYQKTGATSGLTQLASVDGARGNEDSCYRN